MGKNRVITWRCAKGHEVELVLGPEKTPAPERLEEIRRSFSQGCTRKLRGGAVCAAAVKEIGS